MPTTLTNAHHPLDFAVDAAYAQRTFSGEGNRIALLFALYQQLTSLLEFKQAMQ